MEYYIVENPDELYHYGVKGMKWGVRKKDRNERYKHEFRRLSNNADDHYQRAIKRFNYSVNSSTRKEAKINRHMAEHQMSKANFYAKQAKKYARKAKRTGSPVELSERQKHNVEEAGKLFVKKTLLRRTIEKASDEISIGAQYALQRAILGRPIVAIGTEYSSYKVRRPVYNKKRRENREKKD